MKETIKKSLVAILGGVVLTIGWGVDIDAIGLFRFVSVWAVGSLILTELMPYMTKK